MRLLALCLVLSACGGSKEAPGHLATGGTSTLKGGVVGVKDGSLETGIVNLTIKGTYVQGLEGVASTVEASGVVQLRSNPRGISLAGTYDSAGRLVVTGGDYTFTATTGSHNVLSGTFTYGGQEPPPVTDGSFVLVADGSEVYCGSLGGGTPLVLSASADRIEALLAQAAGLVRLSGTRTDRDFTAAGGGLTLTGSADGADATGTYAPGSDGPSTFEAHSGACLTP
jgi:hypothetical protein